MSALRRDLIERRLWPLAVLLLAAVIAIPVLALTNSSASGAGTSSPPHISLPGLPATTSMTATTSQTAAVAAGTPRDPFASSTPKLSSTPAAPLGTSTGATSSSTTTATTVATSGAPATVTPTPTTTTAQTPENASAVSANSSGASAVASNASASTSNASANTSNASAGKSDSSAAKSSTTQAQAAKTQSWTIYAVDLRIGTSTTAPVRRNVARLTPLPSSAEPELIFMGVMAGGRKAAFALAADVLHQGPGECRPHLQVCSTILLGAGQTEQLAVPTAAGGQEHLVLRVGAVRSSVTHSHATALAAYRRHSAAGQCDLDLAAPMAYSQFAGTLSGTVAAACKGQTHAIPFPSAPASQ